MLSSALDNGIREEDFWRMTFAELQRETQSRNKKLKYEARERATFDYIMADLIGRSVSRIYNSANKMPDISEVYPTLFDNEEAKERKRQKQAEVSALRFKMFANSFNNRRNKEVGKANE